MHHELSLITTIAAALGFGLLFGMLAVRLKLPALVGYLAARKTEVPPGMIRYAIPPGRYLRLIHDGPLVEIAAGFEKLYAHAAVAGLKATDFKLDFGYLVGLPPGRHELHVRLEPEPLKLA